MDIKVDSCRMVGGGFAAVNPSVCVCVAFNVILKTLILLACVISLMQRHAELYMLLSCIVPLSWVEHLMSWNIFRVRVLLALPYHNPCLLSTVEANAFLLGGLHAWTYIGIPEWHCSCSEQYQPWCNRECMCMADMLL